MTRAKFTCVGVTKRKGWTKDIPFIYDAEFNAVTTDGSEEDKAFFAATPSGRITIGTVRDDHFQVGKVYYVEFKEAES